MWPFLHQKVGMAKNVALVYTASIQGSYLYSWNSTVLLKYINVSH